MTDDADELDRRLARLFEEGRRREDPEDHPAPEKLSAYQAKELPPEEADAIQEHLVQCAFCTDLLLDLASFLEPQEEEGNREGVADLAAEAGWRKVRAELPPVRTTSASVDRRLPPAWITWVASAAAVLGLVVGWTSYRKAVQLETTPITDLTPTTVISQENQKGPDTTEPTLLKLGRVAAFETLSDHPYPRYRLIFRDQRGQVQKSVEDSEDDDGKITMFLPNRFLPPGLYKVEVVGLGRGAAETPIRDFDIRISQ